MVEPRKEPYSLKSSLSTLAILLALTVAPVGSATSLLTRSISIQSSKISFPAFFDIYGGIVQIGDFGSALLTRSELIKPFTAPFLEFNFDFFNRGMESLLEKLWIGNQPTLLSESSTRIPAEEENGTASADTAVISTPWWAGWLAIPLFGGLLWWLVKDSGTNRGSIAAVASNRKQKLSANLSGQPEDPTSVNVMPDVTQSIRAGNANGAAAMKTLENSYQRWQIEQNQQTKLQENLIVDGCKHCFYIDPAAMNKLQKQTAVSMVLQPGTYQIKLKSGAFDCQIEAGHYGEPVVLLWLYGGRMVNYQTGVEVGTTWSSLNGYEDVLSVDVREPTTLAAFFIDTQLEDNEGEVLVVVEGINQVASLIVHSQENCYRFDLASMQRLEQESSVSRRLQLGTYSFQIKQGAFNYRKNSGHAGEPWVLLWILDGKVMNRKTGITVRATWASLNGYEDMLWLDVQQPATLCAFFLDTYLDDNDGEVTVSMTYFPSFSLF